MRLGIAIPPVPFGLYTEFAEGVYRVPAQMVHDVLDLIHAGGAQQSYFRQIVVAIAVLGIDPVQLVDQGLP